MAVGFTTVSAQHLQDATGTPIANATIVFTPVSSLTGQPIAFRSGGNEGATCFTPVSTTVSEGAFSIALADTTLTTPINIGYSVAVYNNDPLLGIDWQSSILGPGYNCIQPSGATWSFDDCQPNLASMVTVQYGPQGTPGMPGGVAGSVLEQIPAGAIDGTNITFTVTGTPAIPLLFKNGVFQVLGSDYTFLGSTITFYASTVPVVGDSLYFVGISSNTSGSGSTGSANSLTSPASGLYLADTSNGQTYFLTSTDGRLDFQLA